MPGASFGFYPYGYDSMTLVKSGDFVKIAQSSGKCAMLLESNGSVWHLGNNTWVSSPFSSPYVSPIATGFSNTLTPEFVTSGCKDVAATENCKFYLKNNGDLFGVGGNTLGELSGITGTKSSFTLIATGIENIHANDYSVFHITATGDLYGTGYNNYGQLGLGDTVQRNTFTLIAPNIKAVYIGRNDTLFLGLNGDLYGSGRNDYGQLGLGDTVQRTSLTLIASNVTEASLQSNHSMKVG